MCFAGVTRRPARDQRNWTMSRMQVLIVERQDSLAELWSRHLQRLGAEVLVGHDSERAIRALNQHPIDVLVINLSLDEDAALAISDYAAYRRPEAKVIFVTSKTFFSDGSIFQHAANAAVMLPQDTPPADLAAVVEHYAGTPSEGSRVD